MIFRITWCVVDGLYNPIDSFKIFSECQNVTHIEIRRCCDIFFDSYVDWRYSLDGIKGILRICRHNIRDKNNLWICNFFPAMRCPFPLDISYDVSVLYSNCRIIVERLENDCGWMDAYLVSSGSDPRMHVIKNWSTYFLNSHALWNYNLSLSSTSASVPILSFWFYQETFSLKK